MSIYDITPENRERLANATHNEMAAYRLYVAGHGDDKYWETAHVRCYPTPADDMPADYDNDEIENMVIEKVGECGDLYLGDVSDGRAINEIIYNALVSEFGIEDMPLRAVNRIRATITDTDDYGTPYITANYQEWWAHPLEHVEGQRGKIARLAHRALASYAWTATGYNAADEERWGEILETLSAAS